MHVIQNKCVCLSGKSCGRVHAASPSTSSALTGHRHREGLSSRRLKSTFSDQACEQGGWCGGGGGGWKISPDFKIVKSKSKLLYCNTRGGLDLIYSRILLISAPQQVVWVNSPIQNLQVPKSHFQPKMNCAFTCSSENLVQMYEGSLQQVISLISSSHLNTSCP